MNSWPISFPSSRDPFSLLCTMHFIELLEALLMQIIFLEAAATQTQFLYLDLCARESVFF
jgi:hypothetical protein